ncbi:MAG: glycosyltransferase [Gemmatimonadaceae bacterium]|nr:glycosyltransferase [Gemmatimonadaceae bacterium]
MPTEPTLQRASAPTISVLVPSWRRPDDLARCLRSLAAQRVQPLEVVVGARTDDSATAAVVAADAALRPYPVVLAATTTPGVVAAMSAALKRVRGEAVAFTDDDCEPRPDWIDRIGAAFADPGVGGVGGRDWQPVERGERGTVGRVQWFGRMIGNHHLGSGPARAVDVLKGANAAFRSALVAGAGLDHRLRGAGAQMHWELALCLPLRRAGWTLVYDPAIAVDHHVASRHDADQRHRGTFVADPQADAVHNETLVLLEYLGAWPRLAFMCWALAIGTRMEPGLAQAVRLLIGGDATAAAKFRATATGRLDGWRSWRRSRGSPAGRASGTPAAPAAPGA